MTKPFETREKVAPARQRSPRQLSPGTVLVAVVFLLLVAGYLANALWNLLHRLA